MDSVAKIGDRIRMLREENGLTQQALADALHVKRETINMWENGFRDLKTGAISALAEFFNVSSDYLLGRVEYRTMQMDKQTICKKTGLSEQAVDQMQNGFFLNPKAIGLLNELITLEAFHECIIYMQATFDLFDPNGSKSNREFDGEHVSLSGEFASDFFRQSANSKFSQAFGLMELSRRREGYKDAEA